MSLPFRRIVCLLIVLPWIGCLGKAPLRQPATTLPPSQEIPKPNLQAHLIGQWELPNKGGNIKQMIFESGGRLMFRGSFEYFNPAEWQLDAARQELRITFPSTPNEKLDIFHLYVGQGVVAFDRALKEVTYHFDEKTWDLNIAGWTYSKPDNPAAAPLAEPVIR
jgi:hypothetical protein